AAAIWPKQNLRSRKLSKCMSAEEFLELDQDFEPANGLCGDHVLANLKIC
ncbi:unnamed protein product, partial [Oikopleura dioica]